jgi:autotransporter translocation and assembly factor TamB
MSEDTTKRRPNRVTRGLFGLFFLVLVFVFILFGLRWWITTDGGSDFLESQIESRQLGPLKRVEVDGLSGDPLDKLSIEALRVYDRDGLWLSASDIEFDWSPWPLHKRHLFVEDLDIAEIDVLRRPSLEETKPGDPFTARIDAVDIESLQLDESIIGQAATLQIGASGGLLDDQSLKAEMNIIRVDAEGDVLALHVSRAASGEITGTFDIQGQPGGTVATLLNAPSGQTVNGTGEILGSIDAGSGTTIIRFGETQSVDATVNWTPEKADVQAKLSTVNWALFDASRQALGNIVDLNATLIRSETPQRFTLAAKSPKLSADISGQLPEAGGLPTTVDFDIRSARLGVILPLPEGYGVGSGTAKGQLNRGEVISGRADINVTSVVSPYGRAARLSGPVSLMPVGENYRIITNLRATSPITTADLPFTLGEDATLKAQALINPVARRVSELDAILSSGGNVTTAKGRAGFDGSQMNLSGRAEVDLKAIGNVPSGALKADYALVKHSDTDLAVTANGTFRPEGSFAPPLENLVGEVIDFDIDMSPMADGVRLRESLLTTDGLRVAAVGDVADQLDLSAEIAVFRPVSFASLDITEPSTFSATLTGARTDPNLRLDGTVATVTLAGQSFETVRLRTEVSDLLSAPKGPVRVTAETAYGPLDLEARLASTELGYGVNDLDLTIGKLSVGGDLALDQNNIATGQISLNLPQEGERYARATIDLDQRAGEQRVALQAEAKNVAYGNYAVETFSLEAAGTFAALTGEMSVEGREIQSLLTREFGLKTPFTLNRSPENIYQLSLNPEADYGRYQIGHSAPVTLAYGAGEIGLEAPLTLNGEVMSLTYNREDGREAFRISGQELPINLLPLPGRLADSQGQISIELEAQKVGTNLLSGEGIIQISDWRSFDFKEGEGLTLSTTLDLQSQSVGWRLESQELEDLQIKGEGNLPLSSDITLTSIRPNMAAPMSGRLNIKGSAKPLLTLITVEDVEPSGKLDANLDIGGTLGSPQIEGQASGQAIRLELPQLGTRLRDGRFSARFTNDTIDVSDVYFRDTKKGTLEGGGQFKLGEFGRPLGRLDITAKDFRAVDRKDYEGQVSGTLFFESDSETATLGGDVKFDRAEVKQFVQGRAAVVEIEVEEINGEMDEIEVSDRPAPVPINLDLRIRAPRNIFVRTRGLDVELELDATLKGTISDLLLYGEARVRRGGYRIAGKELEFTEGGIEFDGPLSDAQVNLIAETDTQNISATVNITGTVEEPKIELSSTPERPQDEILSALLFGRSVTELSTLEAAQLAGALAQFSGAGGGFDLLGGLRDALGVGQLSIGVGQDGQATFSGGRYLAKDVYLQLFTGAGPDSTGAIIDWEIRRNLSLRSKVQSDNEQSLTLKYKKDF